MVIWKSFNTFCLSCNFRRSTASRPQNYQSPQNSQNPQKSNYPQNSHRSLEHEVVLPLRGVAQAVPQDQGPGEPVGGPGGGLHPEEGAGVRVGRLQRKRWIEIWKELLKYSFQIKKRNLEYWGPEFNRRRKWRKWWAQGSVLGV